MYYDLVGNSKIKWIQYSIYIAFLILTFSCFFGLTLPFQEKTMDAWEQEQSNPINQFFYFLIFILNIPSLSVRYDELFKFIYKERWLGLLILYFLISFIWSDYGFISLKRSFQLLTMYITLINSFCFLKEKWLFSTIKVILVVYVIITYIVSLTIPEAIDPSFNTWRGLTLQKNGLAQISFYIFLLSFFIGDKIGEKNKFNSNLLTAIFSGILVFLAQSSTVILSLFFVFAAYVLFKFDNLYDKIGVAKLISIISLLFITVFVILISIFSSEILSFIPAMFGKDLTLTGRTLIWEYVINEISKRPILGYGYMTYWIMGSSRLDYILVNQSHNSYLEILLWGGATGFIIFLGFVFSYLKRAYFIKNDKFLIALLSILIISFSEGILFQARTITTYTVMFLYIFLYKEFYKNYLFINRQGL